MVKEIRIAGRNTQGKLKNLKEKKSCLSYQIDDNIQ